MDKYKKRSLNKLKKSYENLTQPEDYKLIPLTKGKFAKVDNDVFNALKDKNWYCDAYGYAKNDNHGQMHRLVMNCPKNKYVDHINGDKSDNRISNLRICTIAENNYNKKPYNKTSKYKGVSWAKDRNKWKSTIKKDGKQILIGSFDSEIEAAIAYNSKATEMFGEFAFINDMSNIELHIMYKISIDFDGTLSRKDVQKFTKELIELGIDVWVCTFRMTAINNDDLFEVTDSLGIPRDNIIFTEMCDKSEFLDDSFILHLDDDHYVHYDLRSNTKIKSIDVNKSAYKNKVKRLLGL